MLLATEECLEIDFGDISNSESDLQQKNLLSIILKKFVITCRGMILFCLAACSEEQDLNI